MSGSALLAAMQRAKDAVRLAQKGMPMAPPRVPVVPPGSAPFPAVIPTPPYLGRGAGNPTISNRAPIPGAQPGGGGGALVRQGERGLGSIGERAMRSIGGGATPGATAARVGRGVGAAAGPFAAGAPLSELLSAGASAETATGLGGLLRGLAGRAGGAILGLPGLMAGMAATPSGVGDGTMLGSDEGRAMSAEIDEYAPELEAERIGYSDPIEMSHAPEFSGVGGVGASGFDGVGPDGSALIKGLMRTQTARGEIFPERDSMRPPMSYAELSLNGPAPTPPAGPSGPRAGMAAINNALKDPLFQENDEIGLDESKFADVPMNGQAPVAELPPIPRSGGSDTPGMEALLAGLKKKRDPMGGPILTGGSQRQGIRLGGNVLSR